MWSQNTIVFSKYNCGTRIQLCSQNTIVLPENNCIPNKIVIPEYNCAPRI